MSRAFHIPLTTATAALAGKAGGDKFAMLGGHGSLTVEIYSPQKVDLQLPHDRDECYVVTDGKGIFEMGDETVPFSPGDFIFVPAGLPTGSGDFGDSMTCWVMFYGPEGGGQPDACNASRRNGQAEPLRRPAGSGGADFFLYFLPISCCSASWGSSTVGRSAGECRLRPVLRHGTASGRVADCLSTLRIRRSVRLSCHCNHVASARRRAGRFRAGDLLAFPFALRAFDYRPDLVAESWRYIACPAGLYAGDGLYPGQKRDHRHRQQPLVHDPQPGDIGAERGGQLHPWVRDRPGGACDQRHGHFGNRAGLDHRRFHAVFRLCIAADSQRVSPVRHSGRRGNRAALADRAATAGTGDGHRHSDRHRLLCRFHTVLGSADAGRPA